MVMLVLKFSDYRLDVSEVATMQAMKKFLEKATPTNTYLCFTHCDKKMPKEGFVMEKLKALKKYGDVLIPLDHVIYFDKTKKSLEDFVANMVRSDIRVREDLVEAMEEFEKELPLCAERIDVYEKTNIAY